jgi:hypothetical protein
MKWRNISQSEIESVMADPDDVVDSIKGRKNAH